MSDQIVKHDNSLPGFLLILLPAAFAAVFLSIAWPFILGGVVFLTGNSVWQSYQWAKLSQQVNPYFNQMVLEQQGEIAPLALSARANISAPVADRYLQGKATEIGGVSYRSDAGGTVYSFLTVNALENTFAGLRANESAAQKLDYVAEPATISQALDKIPPASTPISTPEAITVIAEAIDSPTIPASTVVVSETLVIPTEPVVAEVVPETPVIPAEPMVVKTVSEIPAEPVVAQMAVEPKSTKIAEVNTGSSFAQALRGIFEAGNEPVAVEATELAETSGMVEAITISQADLAKRLDVHPSTLYKRRSDVSFGEWTRNRDPEGLAWSYQRDTKEFYRLT